MSTEAQDSTFRRKFPRIRVNLRAVFLIDGLAQHGETTELGESGLSFQYPRRLELGKELGVVLYFSRLSEILIAKAEVKSCEDSDGQKRIGVQFENLTFNMSTKLRRFITSGNNSL